MQTKVKQIRRSAKTILCSKFVDFFFAYISENSKDKNYSIFFVIIRKNQKKNYEETIFLC